MSAPLKSCPKCFGTGGDEHDKVVFGKTVTRWDRCPACNGTGLVEDKRS